MNIQVGKCRAKESEKDGVWGEKPGINLPSLWETAVPLGMGEVQNVMCGSAPVCVWVGVTSKYRLGECLEVLLVFGTCY